MREKILLFIVKLVFLMSLVENKLILKQVVILNRHSLRAPLSNNLKDVSPKSWPEWQVKPGFSTTKGAKLAGYMGSYLAAWLKSEEILPSKCPSEDDLLVLSNTQERALKSAQSFVENGFPDCNINIIHPGIDISNPLFDPIIHNTSKAFKEHAANEIREALNTLHLNYLNEAYELLSQILDYKQSRSCKMGNKCDLVKDKHNINIIPGLRPKLSGPLKMSNEVVNAFLMQNYEGFPTEEVAWGQLTDSKSWETIFELSRAYFNSTYKTTLIAKDLSRPLIEFISKIFLKDDDRPKVTLLVGHDVNIYTVLKTLLVRPYTLENQVELVPIVSAVVFQKWRDDDCQKDYLKLSFVYQSIGQLRYSNILSLESPPHIKILELEKCNIDANGFCPWENFVSFLRSL